MNFGRRDFLAIGGAGLIGNYLKAQDLVYQCPMDPDVRSNVAGVCSRCGMKLRAGIPEPIEFPMDLKFQPPAVKPGEKVQLEFSVLDPENGKLIEHFQIVHEKLFHMFVISQDLQYFVHDHPTFGSDGKFRYEIVFPKPGLYRVLGDFYPDGATPQLIAKTIIVPGGLQATPSLTRDYSTKDAGNMKVSLETEAPQPIAGSKTMMFFALDPAEGLEKYIGAWGHMLAASDDLIDLIHTHPFAADGGPKMQFNVYFPRPQKYRVWVQFQRKGIVNTAYFDIPVHELGD
jgi:Heavy metal binding domain